MEYEHKAPIQSDNEEQQDTDPEVEQQPDPFTLTEIIREMMLMMRNQHQQ